ncbi:MAG: T9SS type A sorting domain-containing protein [Bacteroidales bacterium]|nr:T9SS type A sorting domain-containing protein [Bacteroidales bacterium]
MILLQANDTERNMAQKSIVRFNAQATEAFDMEFDAYYLAGFAPMFYSKSAGEGFALNTLSVLTNETVIPFDFIKNESSEFNIEMVQAVPGAIIYLTDKKANKVVNLTESHTYHFTAVEGDLTDRFLLSFGAVGIDNPDASVVNIYAYHDKVFVNGAAPGSEVKITNLLGQEMIRTSVNGIELKTINAGNLANGVYVVSIISGNNVVSKKVVLEK